MRGRRPNPTTLHLLHGTYHTGKHGRDRAGEPVAQGDLYRAPPGLTPSRRAGWRYAIARRPKTDRPCHAAGLGFPWAPGGNSVTLRKTRANEAASLYPRD